jgi:hypothetical protein
LIDVHEQQGSAMRPNFTFGPLDSVTQYLLYLSIVVIGVLLPLLLQKWREHRDNAARVEQTLAAIAGEIQGNRERVQVSLASLSTFITLLEQERAFLETQWRALLERPNVDGEKIEPNVVVRDGDASVTYSALQSTAWEVAVVANVLSLLPRELLMSLTSLYRGQSAYEEARTMAVSLSVRLNIHSLPIDLNSRSALESRLELTTHLFSAIQYLSGSLRRMEELFTKATDAISKHEQNK